MVFIQLPLISNHLNQGYNFIALVHYNYHFIMSNSKTNADEIIVNIKNVLNNSFSIFDSIGLNEGVLGISLFNYYYYLYTKNDKYLENVSMYLEHTFTYLSTGKDINLLSVLDLIELGKYLCFLNTEKVIDNETATIYLAELDKPIQVFLEQKIFEKDLDAVAGIIAVGHYFLEANKLFNYESEIKKIVHSINDFSIVSNDIIYWNFPFRSKENPTIELGFFHGISGVLFFLALVFEKNILKDICLKLIQKGIRYLQEHQKSDGVNLFPFNIKSKEHLLYQNLVYGDIGIGYTIYRIGSILNNKEYTHVGMSILENAALFKDMKNNYVKDAELIYGSSGLFALYGSLGTEKRNENFKESSLYWLKKTLNHSNKESPWAGYDTYINGFDEAIQLSFSHGICGIAIALMSHKMGLDHRNYLSFFNYK